jgi:Mg2+ and Co2+ transporter CorA
MSKVIPHNWEVPARFRERMGAAAGKQRAMLHEGHLLLVLHEVPIPGDVTRRSVVAWRSVEGAWKTSGGQKGGILGVRALVESYAKAIAEVEDQVEKAQRAADYFGALRAVTPFARAARNLHKALQSAREGIPNDADIITLRDLAYEIERTAEIVQADAKAGLDFCVAERSEQQAETGEHIAVSGHKLNLIAALFFPITALGSIFGMNFLHGFETSYAPYLFWIILGFAFVCGFWLRAALGKAPR